MNDIKKKIRTLPINQRNKLFALWIANIREEGSRTIEVLFYLDDKYESIYKKNRIKYDFMAAKLLAYQHVLNIFYN
jgi:hypothetical protein